MQSEEVVSKPESSSTSSIETTLKKNNNTNTNSETKGNSKNCKKQQRACQRIEQLVNDNLKRISGSTVNLPPIDQKEAKFSGRARLYLTNLPPTATKDDIKSLFEKYGEIGEIYINHEKAFAFVKLDYPTNAAKAKYELNGYPMHGRFLVIKNAQMAVIHVKNLPSYVSNELLHMAFAVFGEIVLAYVMVNEHGKSTGEGLVEYSKKSSAMLAINKCSEHAYLLTSSLRPVIVESYDFLHNTDGYPESVMRKSNQYFHERDIGPRFAIPGSFEYKCAERWKQIYKKYQDGVEALKSELYYEEKKLETEIMSAQYDYETEQLKETLRARERNRKRFIHDWEMQQQKYPKGLAPSSQDSLALQANQLDAMLSHQEQELQSQWHGERYENEASVSYQRSNMEWPHANTSNYWYENDPYAYDLPNKRNCY